MKNKVKVKVAEEEKMEVQFYPLTSHKYFLSYARPFVAPECILVLWSE